MKKLSVFILACLFASASAFAAEGPTSAPIQKWTDANGVVHYGDQAPDGVKAETLNIRLSNSSVGSEMNDSTDFGAAAPAPAKPSVKITSPAPDTVIRDNSGEASVTISADVKNLPSGATTTFYLDGVVRSSGTQGTGFSLARVERGTHTARIAAVDEQLAVCQCHTDQTIPWRQRTAS